MNKSRSRKTFLFYNDYVITINKAEHALLGFIPSLFYLYKQDNNSDKHSCKHGKSGRF